MSWRKVPTRDRVKIALCLLFALFMLAFGLTMAWLRMEMDLLGLCELYSYEWACNLRETWYGP